MPRPAATTPAPGLSKDSVISAGVWCCRNHYGRLNLECEDMRDRVLRRQALRPRLVLQPLHAMVPDRAGPGGALAVLRGTVLGEDRNGRGMLAVDRGPVLNRVRTGPLQPEDHACSSCRLVPGDREHAQRSSSSQLRSETMRQPGPPASARPEVARRRAQAAGERERPRPRNLLPGWPSLRRGEHVRRPQGVTALQAVHP